MVLFQDDDDLSSGIITVSTDSIHTLRQDYREHLQTFYATLNLAPPYHSIERAVQHLANTLMTKPATFLQVLLEDPQQKWSLYEKIFEASGLARKHRGIIKQLAQAHTFTSSDKESLLFLRVFTY
jgi:hypothetical protein